MIGEGENRILEIGCGSGATLSKLKELGRADVVVGIELDDNAARRCLGNIDGVIVGDAESMEMPFLHSTFDYIIFGDVLEHMITPRATLEKCLEYLSDDGFVVASIPNIRNLKVLLPLVVLGEFMYSKDGILDEGHLRFFTKKSIRRLFEQSGMRIVEIRANCDVFKNLNRVTLRTLESLLAVKYLVKANKVASARLTRGGSPV